jgi:hypothetical protein
MQVAEEKKPKARTHRIRGITADAKTLGVTREHLFLVLRGHRQSDPLRARYQALKKSQQEQRMKTTPKLSPQGHAPMPPEFSACQNLQPSFFQTLKTLGLSVVIVSFAASKDSPIWGHAGIEQKLEAELQGIEVGQYDSSFFPLGTQIHFFHVDATKLGIAINALKTAVEKLGLLDIAKIYHAENSDQLRVWFGNTDAGVKLKLQPE